MPITCYDYSHECHCLPLSNLPYSYQFSSSYAPLCLLSCVVCLFFYFVLEVWRFMSTDSTQERKYDICCPWFWGHISLWNVFIYFLSVETEILYTPILDLTQWNKCSIFRISGWSNIGLCNKGWLCLFTMIPAHES